MFAQVHIPGGGGPYSKCTYVSEFKRLILYIYRSDSNFKEVT